MGDPDDDAFFDDLAMLTVAVVCLVALLLLFCK